MEKLTQRVKEGLPGAGAPVFPQSDAGINAFLDKLVAVAHHDEYYVIIDLNGDEQGIPQIIWSSGIQRCLGYDEAEARNVIFTLDLIHEQYRDQFMRFASAAYRILSEFDERLESLQQRYIINLPIRKANGKYVWVKQMSMPLRMDANGRIVHQMNCYTIMSGYKGVKLPFAPRIYDKSSQRRKDLEEKLFHQVIDILARQLTATERNVLKTYIKLSRNGSSDSHHRKSKHSGTNKVVRRDIEEELGLEASTIRTHLTHIKEKAENFFSGVFYDFNEMFETMVKFGVEKHISES